MPLHSKARELVKSGLYSGLGAFEELEKRITAIVDDKRKGDALRSLPKRTCDTAKA